MPAKPIRVLCVDDNDLVCGAMQRKLAAPIFEFLGYLLSADELTTSVARANPDLVVLDMNMPGKDPIEALKQILKDRPDLCVVVLSGVLDEQMIDRALDAGARGYISKGEESATIVDLLQRAVAGEVVLSPQVMTHWAGARRGSGLVGQSTEL